MAREIIQIGMTVASISTKEDDAATVAVGPDTQRQADQRAAEHGRGGQQAELGFRQAEHAA
ncbi:hypothetical protein ACU4HD_06725 [Cupriavidus basilensis]